MQFLYCTELIEHCRMHLVYLGFGIFLKQIRRPPIDVVRLPPVLGVITSNDKTILVKLTSPRSDQSNLFRLTGTTQATSSWNTTATATAGSAAQLPHVEAELKLKPELASIPVEDSTTDPMAPTYGSNWSPDAQCPTKTLEEIPFSVNIVKLTEAEINRYTKKPTKSDVSLDYDIKPLLISVCKLPLQPN